MKKIPVLLLITLLLFTLACTISYEGINWGFDEDVEKVYSLTETASAPGYEPITSGDIGIPVTQIDSPEATSEPAPPSSPVSSNVTAPSGDQVEYAVSATNNGCTCSVGGNMMIDLDIQDEKLFFNLTDGTSYEFAKVSPNTYKRSYMGYYILVDSSTGEETRVDEEQHTVIILTEDGFISEYYQGTESSPCCFHTYTNVENAP